MGRIRWAALAGPVAIALMVGGCVGTPAPTASPSQPTSPPSETDPTATPGPATGVEPSGEVQTLAEGLQIPWSVIPLETGGALISERDTARVLELDGNGRLREAGLVPGVRPGGEGGLLGIALLGSPGDADAWLYAQFTSGPDNRVVRMPLTGEPGSLGLGEPEVLLTGLVAAGTHNGGRIKFGPDGMLYVTVGDAQQRDRAQDPTALAGKILRLTPEGDVPEDNPFDGSPVWSYGHRNPQGIAWDDSGRLWASEFGQNTWDELNLIEPGGNYGWPVVEGQGGGAEFVDPVFQWSPSEASPSGLAFHDGTLFLASLRGERIWTVGNADAEPEVRDWFVGEFGRIRDVTIAPDGALWFLTNDTGNDRLLRVELLPRTSG